VIGARSDTFPCLKGPRDRVSWVKCSETLSSLFCFNSLYAEISIQKSYRFVIRVREGNIIYTVEKPQIALVADRQQQKFLLLF
jgi:hypothetical protein